MKFFSVYIGIFFSLFTLMSSAHQMSDEEYNALLKQRFSEQHQAMIPVVAVADMFFACNRDKKFDAIDHQIDDLVNRMDRDRLAEKLVACLGEASLQSDTAINYGLRGCFHAQMAALDQASYDEKMAQLEALIASLPMTERQKSLTQCVTDQAIYYLK